MSEQNNNDEINDYDLAEIARNISAGNTSGILDDDEGYRISWEITINKFKY